MCATVGCDASVTVTIPANGSSQPDLPDDDEEIAGGSFIWSLSKNGVLTLTGKGRMPDYTLDTLPWKEYRDGITKVVIGEGITTVGALAFYGCNNLATVELPSTVTHIERYAFYSCKSLSEFTVPEEVEYIGTYAFRKCSGLVGALTFEKTSGWSAGDKKISATELTFMGYELIAVENYKSEWTRDVNAPEDVVDPNFIAGGMIRTNIKWTLTYTDETRTTMKLTVSGVGKMLDQGTGTAPWYEYRSQIVEIEVQSGVTYIGRCAFYNLTKVTNVTLNEGLESIGDYAFNRCSALTEITIPSTVTKIGKDAFAKSGLSEIPTV